MTDSIATPTIARFPIRWLRLAFPKVRVGSAFTAVATAVSEAAGMAYVAPYRPAGRRPPVTGDDGQQGRDPNW